ncbi:MAG: hypothetical protein LUQ71_06215 [Methanoregula sp.]|nr:hypothetical protein [Methanoregula sp.]
MNTSIIMIGLAFVLFSVALMVSPSDASGPDTTCSTGCWSIVFFGENRMEQGAPGTGGIIAGSLVPFTAPAGLSSVP